MSEQRCPEGWVKIAAGMWTPGPDHPSQKPEYWIVKCPAAGVVEINNERERDETA